MNVCTKAFYVHENHCTQILILSSPAKGTKKCVIKRIIKFNDYKNCLLNNKSILKTQQRSKSEAHNVYTEEINKIALSSNDDKKLQTFDIRITSYPYGAKMLEKYVKQRHYINISD